MTTNKLALILLLATVSTGPVAAHGPLEDRLALIERAIATDPPNHNSYLRRAELRLEAGDLAGAWVDLDVYETLLRRLEGTAVSCADNSLVPSFESSQPSPNKPLQIHEPIAERPGTPISSRPVRLLRARLLEAMGQTDRARSQLDELLHESPNDLLGFRARADLLSRRGDSKEAATDYARAFEGSAELDPDLILSWARTLVTIGSPIDAVAALDAAEHRFGAVPILLLEGAEIERASGRFSQALERLERCERVSPPSALLLATRARVLRQAGRIDEARAVYTAALSTLEHSPIARRNTRASQALASELRAEVEALR